ncbi:MAG: NAD-dependent epimerase/dehydratase family protein [Bacteroidota bacterium]
MGISAGAGEIDYERTVLVTGGTGLVGAYLLRYLVEQGYQNIRAIFREGSDRSRTETINTKIEWLECDILDVVGLEEATQSVDQIYHCAAMISFNQKDRKEMMEVNVTGTANLVNVALYNGVRRFLQVSSVAAIARTKPGQTLKESDKWERSPYNTQYGLSKYLAEQEAWRGFAEGLEMVVVNPSIILGVHQWNSGPARFFPLLARGFSFYPAGGSGFVDVRDVVFFMVKLMESQQNGERFILNAQTLSYQSFFQKIANSIGAKIPRMRIAPTMQQIAWRLAWVQQVLTGKPSLITKETAAQSSRTYYYDASKSTSILDFAYRDLDKTIAEIGAFYQLQSSDFLPF